ncbi:hypothetical protein EV421DRAFT_1733782 [Armillaria borealis]|uniref:Uncharacterized protein n=1 Tax=Armillaria borealis TaxID=47425 RepID=A0AA39MVD3_9AGAR|nr:hypothetical protein EV421DRAFT_1733782 [Armillaria borealis]
MYHVPASKTHGTMKVLQAVAHKFGGLAAARCEEDFDHALNLAHRPYISSQLASISILWLLGHGLELQLDEEPAWGMIGFGRSIALCTISAKDALNCLNTSSSGFSDLPEVLFMVNNAGIMQTQQQQTIQVAATAIQGRSYNNASESGHFFLSTTPLLPTPALLLSGAMWLAHGPGPQPQRQETLAHGPSMTGSIYDVNVPLRHHR